MPVVGDISWWIYGALALLAGAGALVLNFLYQRSRLWFNLAIGAVTVGLLAYGVADTHRRNHRTQQLAAKGVGGVAHVERKWTAYLSDYQVYYLVCRYAAPNGRSFCLRAEVNSNRWASLNIGDTVSIVYLPQSPGVSVLEEEIAPWRYEFQGETR